MSNHNYFAPEISPEGRDIIRDGALGLLLYRLGGQQVFTLDEIADISKVVGGVIFALTKDGKFVLSTRSPEQARVIKEEIDT
jgi:hypothetical protein